MRVTKLNSSKTVLLKVRKYLINWDDDSAFASKLEVKFKNLIYPYWKNYLVLFQCRIPGSLLRLDFLNCSLKLIVEVMGRQHSEFNKFFHRDSRANYLQSIK